MKAKYLRFILGDQLNPMHSWFERIDEDVIYVIAELHQELLYTKHHIQKITAFFAAMNDFAQYLKSKGHRVCYLTLDDTAKVKDLTELINKLTARYSCESFTFQRPDEFRLRAQLLNINSTIHVPTYEVDTEHFILPFDELPSHFKAATHVRMENFYRYMRKHFSILMKGSKPKGDSWNFDASNRQSFKKADIKLIPKPLIFNNEAEHFLQRIKKYNIPTIGEEVTHVSYPINRELLKRKRSAYRRLCDEA